MSNVPPEIVPPQIPPELPQPQGGVLEAIREAAALPGRFLNWLGTRITSLSFAAYMGWFVFFTLLAIVTLFWFVLRHDGDVPWQQTLTVERILVGGLVLLIPFVTYKAVQNWTEGVTSEFPDIQDAWNQGLTALRQHNVQLDATPLFLILGSGDQQLERSLMAAAGLQYVFESVPPGPAPLRFYAGSDAIYVILSDASWLSALVRLAGEHSADESGVYTQSTPGFHLTEVLQGTQSMDDLSRRTLDVATFMAQRERAEEVRQRQLSGIEIESTLTTGTWKYGSDNKPVKLSAQEAIDQTERIRHVAELIRRARYPLCPINGILVLIPYNVLTATDDAVREVQRAIKSDLAALQETLALKAPTVALFTGLEHEASFRELVRRVGPTGAARQRFGQGMDIRCRATADELEAISAHACGAFEDWVYTLFRQDGALTRPGNTLLHSLLCTVRSQLKQPISELLANGFGNSSGNPEADIPFAGCYFAATGDTEDQQAFVRGVFDKLRDLHEDLEWTSRASSESRNIGEFFRAGVVCCIVLAATLAVMIVQRVG